MSMSIKLLGVPGPKLLDDERFTQDLLGVSTPTFVTPDTRANVQLQRWSLKNASPFYFMNLRDSHVLDSIMQLLWTKTQSSPLEGTTSAASLTCSAKGRQCSTRSPRAGRSDARAAAAAPPTGQLPARRDGRDAGGGGRRVRHPAAAPDRSVPDADREQRRAVADEAVAARAGRRAPDPEADVRLTRAARLRAGALLQPVALDRRAPPARQPEQDAEAHVLRAGAATAADERRRALRADGRRGVPRLARPSPPDSAPPRGRAGRSRRRPSPRRSAARSSRAHGRRRSGS